MTRRDLINCRTFVITLNHMKRIFILFIAVIYVAKPLNAQPNDNSGKKAKDSLLTIDQFNNIYQQTFTNIVNNNDKTTIGNFASADPKEGKIALNATLNLKKGNFITVNTSGGIREGLVQILNNTKFSNNFAMDLKYTSLIRHDGKISYWKDDDLTLQLKEEFIRKIYSTKKLILSTEYSIMLDTLKRQISELDKKDSLRLMQIRDIDSRMIKQDALMKEELRKIQAKYSGDKVNSEYKKGRDSIEAKFNSEKINLLNIKLQHQTKILPDQKKLDSLQRKLQDTNSITDSLEANEKKYDNDIFSLRKNFAKTGITFHWISMGGGFNNDNFKLFNPNYQTLDSQLIKKSSWSGSLSFDYNHYHWKSPGMKSFSYFYSIGVKGIYSDNYSDLNEVELTDTQKYGDSMYQRTKTSKIIAYEGDYKNGLFGAKIYFDFYGFLWKNNAALHIFPEVNYLQNKHPIYNTGFGFLYSFKDAKDKENKARVNIEVYFRLLDLSDQERAESDKQQPFYKRNNMGLRLSIPFNFNKMN